MSRNRWITAVALLSLLTTASCSAAPKEMSAEERRNSFDACKISLLQSVSDKDYAANQKIYDKQVEAKCAPLLTLEKTAAEAFKPTPLETVASSRQGPVQTFAQACAKVKAAAYAHREFSSETEDYDAWYGRIRSYFRQAASILRNVEGNYSNLIEAAEAASVNARGVNSGRLTDAESLLYSACNISEAAVWKDFDKWLGY